MFISRNVVHRDKNNFRQNVIFSSILKANGELISTEIEFLSSLGIANPDNNGVFYVKQWALKPHACQQFITAALLPQSFTLFSGIFRYIFYCGFSGRVL